MTFLPPEQGGSAFDRFMAQFFGGQGSARGERSVDLTRLLSQPARDVLVLAAEQAAASGQQRLDTDHLLWAATRIPTVADTLQRAGIDPADLGRRLEQGMSAGAAAATTTPVGLAPGAKRALIDSHQVAREVGSTYIGPEHLLLALAANAESTAGRLLRQAGGTPDKVQQAASGKLAGRQGQSGGALADTPTLEQFGRDLTDDAASGKIDPVIGRDSEVEQTIEVLSRRAKNNPVLIGEAGVGKTAIVEGLAQRIADGDVPDLLLGRKVVQLDLTAMVAGTRYRGDFEERMNNLLTEIRTHSEELIIFIDELHMVTGAGRGEGSGGQDAGNMLKPALAKGELHIVGATTLNEYRTGIERDPALERRFQPILVPEPSVEDTLSILHGLRDRYEAHHQVRFTDEALYTAVDLADRYITERFLPDKAIDLIDQAGARVRLRSGTRSSEVRELEARIEQRTRDKDQAVGEEDFERASALRDEIQNLRRDIDNAGGRREGHSKEVTTEDIAGIVSRLTGVPAAALTEQERDRLVNLESNLHGRVIGQHEAVRAVAEAVRRSRVGFAEPGRPNGSFLFLGPTGVGKTELARALAEALFGDEERMIRIDMSEYGERHTVSRLIGAPPGYVGYDEAGQLTEPVRRRPYSVVLLDEIEKAHPEVFNVLLQVLDDGRLTDGKGQTVNFANTVLIMTSNLGSELITSGTQGAVGFGPIDERDTEQPLRERLMRKIRDVFRPEFLNRIDDIIIFRRLDSEQLEEITGLLLEQTKRRAAAQDITVEFTDEAIRWLSETGYQPEFGARPLRRTIQREVDNPLSAMLLNGDVSAGSLVRVSVDDHRLDFGVEHAQSAS